MSSHPPVDSPYRLNFPYYGFDQFNLVKFEVPLDNNCFFHSIMLSVDKNYRLSTNPVTRYNLVMAIRGYIAAQLPSMYHQLSRGHLASYADGVEEYQLETLQQTIRNRECVGLEVMELTSIILDINIVILDSKTLDVYATGDYELLHRKGSSYVIVLYDEDRVHYELVGLNTPGGIITYFNEVHPLIKHIKRRITK